MLFNTLKINSVVTMHSVDSWMVSMLGRAKLRRFDSGDMVAATLCAGEEDVATAADDDAEGGDVLASTVQSVHSTDTSSDGRPGATTPRAFSDAHPSNATNSSLTRQPSGFEGGEQCSSISGRRCIDGLAAA